MKCNSETSMEPHLQETVQEMLDNLNLHTRTWQSKQLCIAGLNGIATAIHALTGEIWACEHLPGGYVFINGDKTECICTGL